MNARSPAVRSNLGLLDATMLIVGVVIGAGIFALPAMVAANTRSPGAFLFAWVLGGAVSFIGALCYAELATAYPHSGGEHHFLRRAFGGGVGFLFAWSRLTVLQTGSIATQAYIVGDYLARLLPNGGPGSAILAAITVVLVTAVNLAGLRLGKGVLVLLGSATCLGVLLVATTGLLGPSAAPAVTAAAAQGPAPAFGLAMVFVLLAFGGWNEAAYISADVSRRNMVRALFWGIAAITAVYLLINVAYLRGLGLSGIAASHAPAADVVERAVGSTAAVIASLAVVVAAVSTMNATVVTGGRSNLALGRQVSLFSALARRAPDSTPRNALLAQAAITLLLVLLGALTREGFVALVEYTAPVFWFFFLLVGVSVLVLRQRQPQRRRPFRVPFYPVTPILFCLACVYMIQSSLAYTGVGALVGVAVLAAGLPVYWLARTHPVPPSFLNREQIRP